MTPIPFPPLRRNSHRGAMLGLVLACAVAGGCASGARAGADSASPRAMLERAIEQAGGAQALERAGALAWEGTATVHAGGREVRIAGSWGVQPPDTALVATYDVTRGPESTRVLVVAAPRGWMVAGGEFRPMPEEMLANERDQFYLYDVLRLVRLRDPEVTLTAVAPDSLGQAGFRAERPGRPAVDVHLDAAGRVAHLRTRIVSPFTSTEVWQDLWFAGELRAQGVRWPAELRITLDGAPYFTLAMRELRVLPRLGDARLRGP
jgi:hypothetical protein